MKGYFVVYENEDEQFDIKCDLRPDVEDEVPELQSLLYSEIENTCNVLKALDNTSDEIKRRSTSAGVNAHNSPTRIPV